MQRTINDDVIDALKHVQTAQKCLDVLKREHGKAMRSACLWSFVAGAMIGSAITWLIR